MYHTILAPLDGSERAEAILPHVESLARCYKAKVVLLQVAGFETTPATVERLYVKPDPHFYDQRLRQIETYLNLQRIKLGRQGVHAEVRVGEGPVVTTILNVADHVQADLIAMTSHGRSGLAYVFYGSVAAGVLHQAGRPLLLIRSVER
jgi:nucleotide-binding universal stress UspA family protein